MWDTVPLEGLYLVCRHLLSTDSFDLILEKSTLVAWTVGSGVLGRPVVLPWVEVLRYPESCLVDLNSGAAVIAKA